MIEKTQREQDEKVNSNCCETYIILDPKKARFFVLWEFIFMVAIFLELFIVPFLCVCLLSFQSIYWTPIEIIGAESDIYTTQLVIDIIWILFILVKFITAVYSNDKPIKNWKYIMKEYACKGLFIIDAISLVPRIYPRVWQLYCLKLLRVCRLSDFSRLFVMFMHSLLLKLTLKNGSKQNNQKMIDLA